MYINDDDVDDDADDDDDDDTVTLSYLIALHHIIQC